MKKIKASAVAIRCLGLVIIVVMMSIGALQRNGRAMGWSVDNPSSPLISEANNSDDTVIINTTSTGRDIMGYAGPVPIEVTIVRGRIASIVPLDNDETPGFFRKVTDAGLTHRWDGLDVNTALQLKVDGVSGATYSSRALIDNVHLALNQYLDRPHKEQSHDLKIVWYATLLVLLAGALLPLWIRSKHYRLLQQLANVAVLGFWGGVFVDYTMMLGFISHPVLSLAAVTTIVLLVVAFIYPIFGLNGHYCAWICPLGSLQDLSAELGKKHRWKLSTTAVKRLTTLRWIMWGALMALLLTGVFTRWVDYELFIAFSVETAPRAILIAAGIIVVISIFIPRPYCRFICPTGSLMRFNEKI